MILLGILQKIVSGKKLIPKKSNVSLKMDNQKIVSGRFLRLENNIKHPFVFINHSGGANGYNMSFAEYIEYNTNDNPMIIDTYYRKYGRQMSVQIEGENTTYTIDAIPMAPVGKFIPLLIGNKKRIYSLTRIITIQ